MQVAQGRKGRKGHRDEIADSADVDNYLIGAFLNQPAAKQSDHQQQVLPRNWSSVNAKGKMTRPLDFLLIEAAGYLVWRGKTLLSR
jgi:hypothetical protein